MASRRLVGHAVDLGAAFVTTELTTPFGSVMQRWLDTGLARPWTDTLAVSEPGAALTTTTGPMRFAAPGGLRSLVADLAEGLDLELGRVVNAVKTTANGRSGGRGGGEPGTGAGGSVTVDGEEFAAVVLAMPDPQARRVLEPDHPVAAALGDGSDWTPIISVALGWDDVAWPSELHGVFVNGCPTLTFLADDGDRRGDHAPVLVAHSTPELARKHLENPDDAIGPITEAVRALLDLNREPHWSYAHLWTFARPSVQHPEPFLLDGAIGVCGDGWGGASSVRAAWASGDALGRELAARLAA
jgi:renalase